MELSVAHLILFLMGMIVRGDPVGRLENHMTTLLLRAVPCENRCASTSAHLAAPQSNYTIIMARVKRVLTDANPNARLPPSKKAKTIQQTPAVEVETPPAV